MNTQELKPNSVLHNIISEGLSVEGKVQRCKHFYIFGREKLGNYTVLVICLVWQVMHVRPLILLGCLSKVC